MRLWTAKAGEDVAAGAVYRRVTEGRTADTARVLALSSDAAGIPHVRFNLHHERMEGADESRTLALAAFRDQYPERAPV